MRPMAMSGEMLRTVLYVVREGSVSAAAKAMDVNTTTVARRIASAEAALGTLLFERRSQGYVATDAGQLAAARAEAMEREEVALRRVIAGRDARMSGPLTITAPQLLIAASLNELWVSFMERYPQIDLTVLATNNLLDLESHEADVAIRISDDPGDNLIGRRLTRQETASFASEELAAHYAANPDAPIDWIGFTFWKGVPKALQPTYPNARIRLMFDDMTAVIGAVQAGLGVARMPMFLGRATPGLVQVPFLAPQPYLDIWVLTHPDLKNAAKVIAFKQMLVAHFQRKASDFVA